MRYIDLTGITLPSGWQDKARDLTNELAQKTIQEKKEYFRTLTNPLWKRNDFVRAMLSLGSNDFRKCWYSETRISDDIDIDHFRPKGKDIKKSFNVQFLEHLSELEFEQIEQENERGWWFLAFDYKNFRVCSCFRNQSRHALSPSIVVESDRAKGKSDFFPLKKGSPVALDADGVQDEINCLLDPCKLGDAEYLSYDQFGNAYTNYDDSTEERKWIKCRVITSIAVYHLDEPDLIKVRKIKWKNCKDFIHSKLKKAVLKDRDREKIRKLKREFIAEFSDKNCEFSAVAIDCIKYYKSVEGWLEIVFPQSTLLK